jgi:hypothetical protein
MVTGKFHGVIAAHTPSVVEVLVGFLDIGQRLLVVGLALFESLDSRYLRYQRLDRRGDAKTEVGPLKGRPVTHVICSLSGSGDGPIDVGRGRQGNRGDMLAGDR